MNPHDISTLRSVNQQITGSKYQTANEIARWMGAMQAQDYSMSKWAFGIRLPKSTERSIDREIDSGKIIRTHLLRPTWHFVSSDDIFWILELTAPQIKSAVKYRDKQLGLTESIFRKCNTIIERALMDGNHSTREELITEMVKSDVEVDNNRASHILLQAEMEGVICSGRQKRGKPTYAILGEWVPRDKRITRDEALKELARRYFTSRGPATLRDFTWWSGLSIRDSRLALEFSKSDLISEVIEKQTYWFADSIDKPGPDLNKVYLIPAYDEFIISYRDRAASLSLTDNKKAISNNGIFYPAILFKGQVIGTWKRSKKDKITGISTSIFKTGNYDLSKILPASLARYSRFIDSAVELSIN